MPDVPVDQVAALLQRDAPCSEMQELIESSAPHGFLIYSRNDAHLLYETTMHLENARSEFDRHTSAEPGPDGTWTARFGSELSGFGGTHGGYLTALALRTMAALVTDAERTPRSLTSHLLAPVRPGAVDLFPRLERTGGSMTSTSLRMEQDGAVVGPRWRRSASRIRRSATSASSCRRSRRPRTAGR